MLELVKNKDEWAHLEEWWNILKHGITEYHKMQKFVKEITLKRWILEYPIEWCNTFLGFVNKAHIRSVPSPRIYYYRKSILHYFIHYIIIMLNGLKEKEHLTKLSGLHDCQKIFWECEVMYLICFLSVALFMDASCQLKLKFLWIIYNCSSNMYVKLR